MEPVFQVARHVVERLAQLGELVVAGQRNAGAQVTRRKSLAGVREQVERLHLALDLPDREGGGQDQRQQEGEREKMPEVVQRAQGVGAGRDLHDDEARAVKRGQKLGAPQAHQQILAGMSPAHGATRAGPQRRIQHLPARRHQPRGAEERHKIGIENAVTFG